MRHEKVCWFCGKATMVPKGDHHQCSECGATWNKVNMPDSALITLERDFGLGAKGESSVKTYRPSGFVQRRVRKAREAKEVTK